MDTINHKVNLQDLIGKKIRMLTVVNFSHVEQVQHADRLRNKYMYLCKCDCGKDTFVSRFHLKQKDSASATWSCGCYQKKRSLEGFNKQRGVARPQMQKPNGESILNIQLALYKKGAKERKLDFNLSKEEFRALVALNCTYCGEPPRLLKKKDCLTTRYMNGIDRVDSSLGYTLENCVPCCKTCNYMKLDMSRSDFIFHLKKVLRFQEKC